MTPDGPPAQEPSVLAGVLSYLVPGLGQISQGRTAKGVMFMGILLGMFLLGQAMGNWRNVFMPPVHQNEANPIKRPLTSVYNRWHFAGQFWIGVAAWPAIWQFYNLPMPSREHSEFWHEFQRAPDDNEINPFITNSDKSPDLGWVYTVVAGMLNILVIYDAVVGPAFVATPKPGRPTDGNPSAAEQPAAAGGAAS